MVVSSNEPLVVAKSEEAPKATISSDSALDNFKDYVHNTTGSS